MFQYALGLSLSIHLNRDLLLDISSFNTYKKRNYELNQFNIKDPILTNSLSNALILDENNLSNLYDIKRLSYFTNDIYLIGYWQNEQYFINIRELLLEKFIPIDLCDKYFQYEKLITDNTVSLHIRRGDYVSEKHTNEFHGICSLDYYNSAIKYFNNPNIMIFTDDIEWVKNNINFKNSIIIDGLSESENIYLMSKCTNNIIANSSFSWWGAWLNNKIDKKVISPNKWFNNIDANNNCKIVPTSWIKL